MSFVKYNVQSWIQENEKCFLPPVCNKMMHGDGQLKVFYVSGPNERKDFHLEEGEEFFYMVKGDMNLITLENNKFRNVQIKEGEVFLLPGRIPHSPQRYKETMGLVIERERLKEEKDCLRYFVNGTTETLFEKWFYCEDLGTQITPVIKEYFASEQHKTGTPIPGTITANPPWMPDAIRKLEEPFSLLCWIREQEKEINQKGKKRLFSESYKSDIFVYGKGEETLRNDVEYWIWQLEGASKVMKISGDVIEMNAEDSLLVASNTQFTFSRTNASFALLVKMKPNK